MADFKARGIYTIGRIVTFKDNILGNGRPDLAIMDTRTGKPWIDRENLAWSIPSARKSGSTTSRSRARRPSGGSTRSSSTTSASRRWQAGRREIPASQQQGNALPAIAGFLGMARRELGPLGVYVAADVFGYTAST